MAEWLKNIAARFSALIQCAIVLASLDEIFKEAFC
jgi:hypothetical protein